jgi:hypothetical protein
MKASTGLGLGLALTVRGHIAHMISVIESKLSFAMTMDNSLFLNIRDPLKSDHDSSRAFNLAFTSSRASHFSLLLLPPLQTGQVLP